MIFTVLFGYGSRFARQGIANFRKQLLADFIETNLRKSCIIGPLIHAEHVFHRRDKGGIRLRWNAPLLFEPGLEFVFLSVIRTVSWLTLSTTSNSTSLSASIRKVQHALPSGGFWQASAIKWASCSPASFRFSGRSGWLRRSTAAGKPSCKKRVRTRHTVLSTAPKASWICLFDQLGPDGPWSTFNRIWACKIWRAGARPVVMHCCKACLCSWLRQMICFFTEVLLVRTRFIFVYVQGYLILFSFSINFDRLLVCSPIYLALPARMRGVLPFGVLLRGWFLLDGWCASR